MTSWYTTTGAFPADKRFDASVIKDPVMAQLYKLDTIPRAKPAPQCAVLDHRPAAGVVLGQSLVWERVELVQLLPSPGL